MNSQDQKLYQQALLAHHKSPVGFERIIQVTDQVDGHNASCGDDITVQINMCESIIYQSAFFGDSCAICRASASIMCQQLEQISVDEFKELYRQLVSGIKGEQMFLELFLPISTVVKYPVRQQCALLPWQTLIKLIVELERV